MHDNVHASMRFLYLFSMLHFQCKRRISFDFVNSKSDELLVFQVYFVCCADTQVSVGLCLNMPINHMWYNKCGNSWLKTTCFVH